MAYKKLIVHQAVVHIDTELTRVVKERIGEANISIKLVPAGEQMVLPTEVL